MKGNKVHMLSPPTGKKLCTMHLWLQGMNPPHKWKKTFHKSADYITNKHKLVYSSSLGKAIWKCLKDFVYCLGR